MTVNPDIPLVRFPQRLPHICPLCLAAVLALAFLFPDANAARAAQDYSQETARRSPDWLRDGVVYEIFPRNFSATGNFNGITAKLDELHDLGVTILWLMPVHPVGKEKSKGTLGSPYAVRDYYAINPDYGTEADLKQLVRGAHERKMKVILDIVANHTAWDSVLMEHPEFYKRDRYGKVLPPQPGWTDVAGLDYNNPKLREYMIGMLKHWIDPKGFDIDGFRCDVAYLVPTGFWEQARAELVTVKSDFMMLAEASEPGLLVRAFDIDYDWPLMHAVDNVFLKGAPASSLEKTWRESRQKFPQGALHLRISDDHDEVRAVSKYGIQGALAASALMFSLNGVPLIYNGMEAADTNASRDPALFEKVPISWQPHDGPPVRDIYRELIKLRAAHAAFHSDRVTWLKNSEPPSLASLMRSDDHDEFVTVINFANHPVTGQVEIEHAQDFKPVTPGATDTPGGFPSFTLKAYEFRIYQRHLGK